MHFVVFLAWQTKMSEGAASRGDADATTCAKPTKLVEHLQLILKRVWMDWIVASIEKRYKRLVIFVYVVAFCSLARQTQGEHWHSNLTLNRERRAPLKEGASSEEALLACPFQSSLPL